MKRFIANVDSFVLLTEPMKEVLGVGERPFLVSEGIVDVDSYTANDEPPISDGIKRIVYTGKMNIKFGIKELVDSFMRIDDSNYRLILCGDGDAKSYVEEKADIDQRIEYNGVVASSKAKEYIDMADVLVNPRPNNEEYTKYSFPSKNIEYLMTGKPVVAYMLDGMPAYYKDFIWEIPAGETNFKKILVDASENSLERSEFKEYAKLHLEGGRIIEAILNMYNL